MSSQCPDTGIQPFCNLIENVVTTFYASLLAHKQTFLDPSVWTLASMLNKIP
ncbi:MAG: hypothetical protein ACEY3L_07000 [Wolbachia sp.]|uniref:hypothetical protein n=1 Tax=Wolbachia endosymbiont (group A) of Tiphia femorata TaxID=2954063 RepID=UPI002230B136|nr:hypothetical protein [Wolbachia endosymbiont (group A) of Tiphia femorata]